MKRSEMLNKIAEFISMVRYEDALNKSCTGSVGAAADEYAEILLDRIETEGMLPPFVDHFQLPQDAIDEDRDWWTLHVSGAAYSGLCEWEPEDEKK